MEGTKNMSPSESRNAMSQWLKDVCVTNYAVIDFMMELRKMCQWTMTTTRFTQVQWDKGGIHAGHRMKNVHQNVQCPNAIPLALLPTLLSHFQNISADVRSALQQQCAGHSALKAFSGVLQALEGFLEKKEVPADMMRGMEGRDQQSRTITIAPVQLAAMLASSFGTPEGVESEYQPALQCIDVIKGNPKYREQFENLRRSLEQLPSLTIKDLQEYAGMMPKETQPLLAHVREQAAAIAFDLFEEITAHLPELRREREAKVFDENDERCLRTFLRFLAIAEPMLATMQKDLLGKAPYSEFQNHIMDMINASVVESSSMRFFHQRFPWATELVPRGGHEALHLTPQENVFLKTVEAIDDVLAKVRATKFGPCIQAVASARQGHVGLWTLHHFGNMLTKTEMQPRKRIVIDPETTPPIQMIKEQWEWVGEEPSQKVKAGTTWRVGVEPSVRRALHKPGSGSVAVWMHELNGKPCASPVNLIDVASILPEETAACTMAYEMAAFADDDLFVVLQQLRPPQNCDPSHRIDLMRRLMKQENERLTLHGLICVDKEDGPQYVLHWIVPQQHMEAIGCEKVAEQEDLPEELSHLEVQKQGKDDWRLTGSIGPYTMPLPQEPAFITSEFSSKEDEVLAIDPRERDAGDKEQVRQLFLRMYQPNKTEFSREEARYLLKQADCEFIPKRGRAPHDQVEGPRGYIDLKQETTPRAWLINTIATVGNIKKFEEFAQANKKGKKGNGNGGNGKNGNH